MSTDTSRVDEILQLALLVAGEGDTPYDRQLGPIHLIKYVYLADLAYARRNGGETFTGIPWQFFHFGPWSIVVNQRIDPALRAIGAEQASFPSDYGDQSDWVRWSIRNDDLLRHLEKKLPAQVVLSVRSCVHKFGKDTPELLHYVYKTEPMLNAAPNQILDFHSATPAPTAVRAHVLLNVPTSKKAVKRFEVKLVAARERLRNRKPSSSNLINPVPNPRFDEVYGNGIAWLETLAGDAITPGEKVAEFAPEVWESRTRREHDPT